MAAGRIWICSCAEQDAREIFDQNRHNSNGLGQQNFAQIRSYADYTVGIRRAIQCAGGVDGVAREETQCESPPNLPYLRCGD